MIQVGMILCKQSLYFCILFQCIICQDYLRQEDERPEHVEPGINFIQNYLDYNNTQSRRMEQLIKVPQLDEYNVPIINYTVYKDVITRFKCLGKVQGEYIKIISECFSDPDTLNDIKTQSKQFLITGKAKDTQITFHRCIGAMKIKIDDIDYGKKRLYDCLSEHGIEEYISRLVNKTFTHREKREFAEFLRCLVEADDENEDEATDCIQTNPIMFEMATVFKNPFPKLIVPPKLLKSGTGDDFKNEEYVFVSEERDETDYDNN